MSNNRHEVIKTVLVSPKQLLGKGSLPIPGFRGRFVVDAGWCAVITVGGTFKEILEPGAYYLDRYNMWQDVEAIRVDRRIKTLTFSTAGEFRIARPVPVEINLDLSITYCVTDPRRVALEMEPGVPLDSLWGLVHQATSSVVAYATIEEIRTQGESLARTVLHRLQAMQLPSTIGLEVLNVLVTSIKATDAGSDALARIQFDVLEQIERWKLDAAITSQSQVTMSWLIQTRDPIVPQILEISAKYGIDPDELLRRMLGSGQASPSGSINVMGRPVSSLMQPEGGSPALLPGHQNPPNPSGGDDVHSRVGEDIRLLEKDGAKVEFKFGTDKRGIPDGSYDIRVHMPRSSGVMITLYFTCPAGYPNRAPALAVDVDGQETQFRSAVLRRWTGQGLYLVDIAREVKQYFD